LIIDNSSVRPDHKKVTILKNKTLFEVFPDLAPKISFFPLYDQETKQQIKYLNKLVNFLDNGVTSKKSQFFVTWNFGRIFNFQFSIINYQLSIIP